MKHTKLVVAMLACALLTGGFASAFVLFNPPGKWLSGDLPRNIQINQNGHSQVGDSDGGVTEIVDAIANSWNAAVPGNVTSTSLSGSPPFVIGDGISTMHFNVGGTGCSGGCLAVTFTPIATVGSEVVNGTSFGGFTDSDIFFNTRTKYYSDSEANGCNREYHIESVAVHEVGHLLGLDHTPVGGATMFASTGQCNASGESLASDDIDGINCIYNNGYGCGGCVADTLVVDSTNCSQPTSGPNAGDFVVETFIVDNCGGAAGAALTRIDVASPDGNRFCEAETSASGRLGCALDNPVDGTHSGTVTNVSKAGLSWPGTECGGGNDPCSCSLEVGGGTGCTPTSNKEKGRKCSDGIDNDCDGLIDGADPDC